MNTPITFSLAHWCLLIAALLPLACAWIAKAPGFGKARAEGGFDNAHPREWLARQHGASARATAAQANSFEGLPFFFCAVLLAQQLGAPQARLDLLALAYVVLRVGYIAAYVGNWPTTRSLLWALGFAVNVWIFLLGWR